jgi:hypothetical protein
MTFNHFKKTSVLIISSITLSYLNGCTNVSNLLKSTQLNQSNTSSQVDTKVNELPSQPIYDKIPDGFADLKPFLDDFLNAIKAGKSRRQLLSFVDENTDVDTFKSVSEGMKGHRMGNLFIEKLGEFKPIDKDALKFTVSFISPISKEKKTNGYIAIRQTNGTWGFALQ